MLPADLDAPSFLATARTALAQSRAALERLVALPRDASLSEVVGAFDAIGRPLDRVRGAVGLASQVHPLEAVRNVSNEFTVELSTFYSELSLNRAVYERLARFDPASASGPLEERLLRNTLRDFRRSGVDRDDATRERISKLNDELTLLGIEFDRNIAEDTRSITIPEGRSGLAGLPADYIAAHPENERGEVVITTDMPDYQPFMSYAERGDLRRALYRASVTRATPKNLAVLQALLEKRHELATLLGYESWAAYATEDKMIVSAGNAREFVARTAAASRSRLEREVADLLALCRRSEPQASVVHDWEKGFLLERHRAETLQFDSTTVRPYFPYASVRDGVLATTAALYSLEFRRNDAQPRWHESVECFDVVDGGKPVARFFLDMHPRPQKYKHAAMFDLCVGVDDGLPKAALVCNFPRPGPGEPALLQHGDVETFFHEFGHLLHHLFGGRQRYLAFSGIATEWDFVEAPSQMYEEWAWDTGVLQRFARHHETGDPIPAELVARMRSAKEYGKGLQVATQMFYAALALELHARDPKGLDTTERMVALKQSLLPFPHEEGTAFQASFGHLNGYSAIYYTYMWSLVIAKDLFSRFDGNLMDPRVAASYRQAILSAGGSKPASDLCRDFLGREYSTGPFEEWLNKG
ncbi:MAG: Zn-dependent oligopeptidase [Planctomycetes bacterium]|nr:Zn-dependent oligopeptidase [Planctomycetota bacterium]